jgi:hypothetical protein
MKELRAVSIALAALFAGIFLYGQVIFVYNI